MQNPTGSVLPLDRRHALLALARKHGVPVFEDECYADLVWDGDWPPALRALDPDAVIHIGSFSKTLAPALRIGYLVADWPVLSRLMPLKTDAGTGAIEQLIIADYFGSRFHEHLAALKPRLRAKLDAMVEAVEREFGTAAEFTRPKGGIFFWMRIPGVDTSALYPKAKAGGVEFNPGAEWSVNPAARDCLRLCFALPTEAQIHEGVARLAEICRQETGIPAVSANVRHAVTTRPDCRCSAPAAGRPPLQQLAFRPRRSSAIAGRGPGLLGRSEATDRGGTACGRRQGLHSARAGHAISGAATASTKPRPSRRTSQPPSRPRLFLTISQRWPASAPARIPGSGSQRQRVSAALVRSRPSGKRHRPLPPPVPAASCRRRLAVRSGASASSTTTRGAAPERSASSAAWSTGSAPVGRASTSRAGSAKAAIPGA